MVLQLLVSGISNGALYALIAFGYVVIFNVTGWLNFPQGQYMFIGAIFTLFFFEMGIPLPLAILLSIIITAIIGVAFERASLGQIKAPSFNVAVLIMSGAMWLYDGVMMVTFGRYPKLLPPFSQPLAINLGGTSIPTQTIWMIFVTIISGVALWYFFSKQLYGKAMRAVAQNPLASQLVGISTRTMVIIAVALSSGIGALCGATIAPLTFVVWNGGTPYSVIGLVAAVIGGGLVSYTGAFAGGVLIGVIESFATGYISSLFKDVILFGVLIMVLIWRPNGLLGMKQK